MQKSPNSRARVHLGTELPLLVMSHHPDRSDRTPAYRKRLKQGLDDPWGHFIKIRVVPTGTREELHRVGVDDDSTRAELPRGAAYDVRGESPGDCCPPKNDTAAVFFDQAQASRMGSA
jgi:hypothetical protein